jgi:hypothetical protein
MRSVECRVVNAKGWTMSRSNFLQYVIFRGQFRCGGDRIPLPLVRLLDALPGSMFSYQDKITLVQDDSWNPDPEGVEEEQVDLPC